MKKKKKKRQLHKEEEKEKEKKTKKRSPTVSYTTIIIIITTLNTKSCKTLQTLRENTAQNKRRFSEYFEGFGIKQVSVGGKRLQHSMGIGEISSLGSQRL